MTAAEELVLVDDAIKAVLSSQEYSINGRSLKRADLTVLYARKRELQQQIDGDTYGAGMVGAWLNR